MRGPTYVLLESLYDLLDTVVHRPGLRIDEQVGAVRRLVGLVDTSEALDDPGPGLLVEALHVPLLALLQRGGHVDLIEGKAVLLVELPGEVPVLLEGGDEGAERHHAAVSEELPHLGHPADVLLAVLGSEAEVLVQPRPDVVAVQPVGRDAPGHEVLLQGEGDGRLPGPAEPREPDGAASEASPGAENLATPGPGNLVVLGEHIGRLLLLEYQLLEGEC